MSERGKYNPEAASNQPPKKGLVDKLKKGLAVAGLLVAAERAGMQDVLKKEKPTVSAKEDLPHNDYGKSRLLDVQPNLHHAANEGQKNGLEPQSDYDTDEAEAKRIEYASHLSNLIVEKNIGILTVVCIGEECEVSMQERLPGAADEDRSVLKYRFDDSGNCYLDEIAGDDEEDGRLIEAGQDQEEIILSIVDSALQFKKDQERANSAAEEKSGEVFSQIEGYLSQGMSVDSIIKEKGVAQSSLYDLYISYAGGDRSDPDSYEKILEQFFIDDGKNI